MKKDLEFPQIEDVMIVAVKEKNQEDEEFWKVYLINLQEHDLETVLIRSNGYGEKNGQKVETSELRHSLNRVPSLMSAPIETLMEDVFFLTNRYWVSYFYKGRMYDKKFVFGPGSISEESLEKIPFIDSKGVPAK